MNERYIQRLPALNLAIKRNTPDVPPDGRYYVLLDGTTLGVFPNLKRAQERYRQHIAETGYRAPAPDPLSKDELVRREDLERDMQRTANYWADSHQHRGGGGKLRYR